MTLNIQELFGELSMFEEKVRLIIQKKYVELVNMVIEELKVVPLYDPQNSSDRSFNNAWEAFVHQLQAEDNSSYYTSLHGIEEICQQKVQTLSLTELKLLWLISDGCLEWDDTQDFPEIEQMLDEVSEELLSWVEQEAEEPEFEEEDDEDEEESTGKQKNCERKSSHQHL